MRSMFPPLARHLATSRLLVAIAGVALALCACTPTVGTVGGRTGRDADLSLNAPVGKVTSSALPGRRPPEATRSAPAASRSR